MASLAFPQLSSGAMAQYPLRRRRVIQSPVNAFDDGSMLTSNINANSRFIWELAYRDLTSVDQAALQALFTACNGQLLPFTFIDPTDNMLSNSSILGNGAWEVDPLLAVNQSTDPLGGSKGFLLVNSGQVAQKISQQITAPANFQYCFSVYASSSVTSSASLSLTASNLSSQSESFVVGPTWMRLVTSVQLSDNQMSFTASIVVPPAQSIAVFGPQLEPQLSPSRYRETAGAGGVYQNAHLLGDSITFESDAAGLFSTLISIETT